jgi:hypothetical protein
MAFRRGMEIASLNSDGKFQRIFPPKRVSIMSAQPVDLPNPSMMGGEVAAANKGPGDANSVKSSRNSGFARMLAGPAQDRMVVDREVFMQVLALETKRAERSDKRFMLVLLHEVEMSTEIASAISSVVRDTDVVGWYDSQEATLGVICTELAEPDSNVAAAILNRMTDAMSKCINSSLAYKIGISCHIFRDRGTVIDSYETLFVYPNQVSGSAKVSQEALAFES